MRRVLYEGEMGGEVDGRGTQMKVKVAAKQASRSGIKLVTEFGTGKQQKQARKATRVVNGVDRAVSGGGCRKPSSEQ